MTKLYMVQVLPGVWQIQSAKGHIIQRNIMLATKEQATDYIRRYTSSWQGWQYEVRETKL